MSRYQPNREMDAVIEAKIMAADDRGIRLTDVHLADAKRLDELKKQIGLTDGELRYIAEQQLYRMVLVAVGERVIQTLNMHCEVSREDLIPSLTAYFEAVDAGEVEAA